uniref:Uncharacterized protein n=1 Tax=Rhizophora mucronata TaxID=61149 RepID=A0A2P2PP92_RHIMU
MLGGAGLPF